MYAAGLTYFSLLAVIPVLCCTLVAAKACRVDQFARQEINARIDAMITNVEKGQDEDLARLAVHSDDERGRRRIAASEFAHQARSISNELFERINRFDVGTLGKIGFGFLLWTVISSLGMVEVSLNQIWQITKPRPIWKRLYFYVFVLLVLALLATVALSVPVLNMVKNVISATLGASKLTQWMGVGLLWLLDAWFFRTLFTLFFASLFFGFGYWTLPNCRVSFRKAWRGGLVAALVFAGWMKVCAVAQVGIAKSSALYGSFAILPIVLAWLYMSWQIVLLGACMVHAWEEGGR